MKVFDKRPSIRPPQRLSRIQLEASVVGRLLKKLSKWERIVLVTLLGVVLVGGVLVGWQALHAAFSNQGTYTEGIVASSLADVEPTVQAFTSVGLLASDPQGKMVGLLADSWHVSDDAKTFDFTLKPTVDRATVLKAYDPSLPNSLFAGSAVDSVDDHGIRVTLKDSFGPFISTFTKPLIPLGPYIVSDRTKEKITLVSRPNYIAGQPHLKTVVVDVFPTTDSLTQALNAREINGVASVSPTMTIPNFMARYTLQLPRKTAAFFNLDRDVVKDDTNRQNLIDRKKFDSPITLSVATTDSLAATPDVQTLLADWRAANVTVTLTALPAAQVQKNIVPSRNYDVLIFGIDYGADPDPYPFWHSSQRGSAGLNLSNFANVDADHLLEAARKTGNLDARLKLYDQFNQILVDKKPWLVIDNAPLTFAVDKSIIGPQSAVGFAPTDRFEGIQTWHTK